MNKLQKMITVMVMAITVFSAVPTLAYQLIPTAYATGTLQASDLGIQYATATGLGKTDIRVTISAIIKVAMGLLGIVAVVIILIGGFTWMTAGGNDEKVDQAKKWIFAGVIGLAIILSAYAIASFVINNLVNATTNPSSV